MLAGNAADDPYYLLVVGDFRGAVAAYDELERSGSQRFSAANRGLAFLNLGLLDRALPDFVSADEGDRHTPSGRSDSSMKRIGLVYWLRGDTERALEVWASVVSGIEAGDIQFSDLAGGVGAGALLWFGSRGHKPLRVRSEEFLRRHARKEAWPGPVGSFLLGEIHDEDLLVKARTPNDRLTARQMCQALFYVGIRAREQGNRDEYQKRLQDACAQGRSALIEVEYYLSGYEMNREGE